MTGASDGPEGDVDAQFDEITRDVDVFGEPHAGTYVFAPAGSGAVSVTLGDTARAVVAFAAYRVRAAIVEPDAAVLRAALLPPTYVDDVLAERDRGSRESLAAVKLARADSTLRTATDRRLDRDVAVGWLTTLSAAAVVLSCGQDDTAEFADVVESVTLLSELLRAALFDE